MKKRITINCSDINEILRLFVLSDSLSGTEERIVHFGSILPLQVTKANKVKVPHNDYIARATGIGNLSKDCKLSLRVDTDYGAQIHLIGKKNELTDLERAKLDNFLTELETSGYKFDREWIAC